MIIFNLVIHSDILNAQEVKETEGGLFGIDDLVLTIVAGCALAIINDWDNFERGLTGKRPKK